MNFKIGDYVTRNSYDNDIVFVVVDIKDDLAILKGFNLRLVADSPLSDLVLCDEEERNDDFVDSLELDIDIEVESYLSEKVFNYPEKDINLIALECKKINGDIKLLEHEDYRWVENSELANFEFAPADIFIVEKLK